MKHKKLSFPFITSDLAKIIRGDASLILSFRKCLGLTRAEFLFYLDNVQGSRPFTDEPKKEDKCICGNTMPVNERGDCPQCGL